MKKLLIIVLILVAGAGSYGYYLYTKPRSGAADMKTAYTTDAKSLFAEFSTDEYSYACTHLQAACHEEQGAMDDQSVTAPRAEAPGLYRLGL